MNSLLYHVDLGFPEGQYLWTFKEWKLDYSRHALQALLTDRYGAPKRMPKTIQFTEADVFEAEVLGTVTTKVCIRISGCPGFEGPHPNMDLCLVLIRSHLNDTLTVKTCWFNERSDTHATLDASKYTRP